MKWSEIKDNTRDIDMLVAEKVMELDKIHMCCEHPPFYSEEIAAAWEVVEKMQEKGFAYELTHDHEDLPTAKFYDQDGNSFKGYSFEKCDLKEAICHASLLAVGALEDE